MPADGGLLAFEALDLGGVILHVKNDGSHESEKEIGWVFKREAGGISTREMKESWDFRDARTVFACEDVFPHRFSAENTAPAFHEAIHPLLDPCDGPVCRADVECCTAARG